MLPLRDNNPRQTTPVVNYLLIATNVLFFFWELSLGRKAEYVLSEYAFVPARFWHAPIYPSNLFSILLSMFLHGGWLHLGGNMLYLWIFGDNIEDRLGHFRYVLFYVICGTVATFSHALVNPGSPMPAIGASGAIAGVLGAYLILFPKARVVTVIPIFMFITIREIPALVVLGLWFVLQLFVGVASVGVESGGVAYFAHIGGFVAGMLLIILMGGLRSRQPQRPISYEDYWR